ncbi:hypothetical protein [Pedobacter miscanthi]|uniref:CAAX protease n=1 Tax=Pedobacter miscanthi TaxID=2259170 RepID=A0A366KX98_9SPHI|nr:hypothetical protein [Pedobacter miscanthi]RBQ06267.1 hypothetical protein DRW42_14365 [Pedobacter miscanthi]
MNYAQLESYISQPRLNRFLRACGNSKTKAQKLYRINLRVAQSFYPIMNLFETFIRNAIYNQIAVYFKDNDWIINQKAGFMSSPKLIKSKFYLLNQVKKAESDIFKRVKTVSASRVIAEQTFGFWTAFFDNHHFTLVGGAPLTAFPYKPPHINRALLAMKFGKIREFRNRIYHNEPICFSGSNIDFSIATQVLNDIHDIIEWINPDLRAYTAYFNNIQSKIDQADTL